MATVDEILTRQAYAAGDETWTKDNNYPSYTMYAEPEYVPVTNKRIADFNGQVSVKGEQNAQFVGFQLPRYDDAMDLSTQNLYIHYQTVYGGSDGVPCNVSWSDNYVRMCWMIPGQATQEPGSIQMMIYATGTDSTGDRTVWKTLPATYTIHDGLEIGGGIPEPDQSWYEQFVAQMEGKVSTAQGHANDAQASKVAAAGSATASAQSADASAKALQENKDYVESQKETFVGYNKRETDLKYANALIGSASGTGRVSVGDAWEAPIPDLEVAGKSDQFTTTGAQLFDASLIPALTAGGVTVEGTADGGYHISGSGDSGTFYKTVKITDLTMLKAGNIMLKNESSVPKFSVRLMDSSSTILFELTADQTRTITEEMLNTEGVYLQHMFYGAVSNVTPGTYYPMLYQDGDGTWEPYTGGQPSPSPDYPQPISRTGTVTTGAQLLPPDNIYSGFLTSADGARSNDNNYRTVWLSLPAGTYTIAIGGGGVIVKTVIDGILNNSSTSIADGAGYTCTLTQDGYLGISFRKQDSSEYTAEPQVMLNTGSIPKPWEPYTGGKPSPSPEYPQPLDVRVTGANLFDASLLKSATALGIKFINNGDGSFTVDGTATGYANTSCPISLPSGTYSVSGGKNQPKFFVRISKDGLTYTDHLDSFTINGDEAWVRVFIQVNPNMTVNETIWPMLNAGSTALPYQPYQSKTATIQLTAPLHGIGEYRDRITMTKRIDRCVELTFDGSEDWRVRSWSRPTTSGFYALGGLPEKMRARPGLCNQGTVTPGETEGVINQIWLGSSPTYGSVDLYVMNNSFYNAEADDKGLAAWKAHLASHPLKIVTYLDAPVETDLPAATQSALNALTTFTGTTHITITAGGPEPDVAVEYVQDTKAVIADIMAQINEIRNGGTT